MPEEASDPISQASQGVNWLVGLSGAAIGGALAKLDWVLKFPQSGKIAFLIAALFFLLSVLAGVFYAFQLFALKQKKPKLDEEKSKQAPDNDAIANAQNALNHANPKVARFHNAAMGTFAAASIATLFCLGFVLFRSAIPSKPSPAVVNHFSLTNIPVHVGGKLSHFLTQSAKRRGVANDLPGGKLVEFRRVQKFELDGTPQEEVAPPAKLDAKSSEAR
jgi:hypothetical protein